MAQYQNRNHAGDSVFLGGGGDGTFTVGDRLKQADVPVETVMGVANGAITGAVLSTAISAAVTAGREGTQGLFANTMRNATGSHMAAVLGGTVAFAALTGLSRFSRARKHNEWSDRHYEFLRETKAGAGAQTHTQREELREQADPAGPHR